MPSSKKQKLSKVEKARRKLKSHSSKQCTPEWKKYDYSRRYDGIINKSHKSDSTNLMLESVLGDGDYNITKKIHKTYSKKDYTIENPACL